MEKKKEKVIKRKEKGPVSMIIYLISYHGFLALIPIIV